MHLPERFGLFTIIVIGEAVAGVVAGEGKNGMNFMSGGAGIMGLIIAFSFWWGYFEGVQGASLRIVNSFEHVRRYQLWLYAHLPLMLGITATAVGVRHVIALRNLEPLPHLQAMIFSGAVGISCLALNSIFLAAYPAHRSRELQRYLIPHYIITLLGVATGFLGDVFPGMAILAILMLLCVAQIFYSFRLRPALEL
jgi:low temperature requirement protein LtrA